MKLLIIGANGYIGSHLIKAIQKSKKDIQITALVNGPDFYNVQKYKNVSYVLFDFRENICSYIDNTFDAVINLAWIGVNGPDKQNVELQKKNVLFTKKLLGAAKKNKIKKLIFSGTITENFYRVYDKSKENGPAVTYGYFKNKAKELCKQLNSSLNIVWLQLANVYGGNNLSGNILSTVINSVRANQPIELSAGNQFYDFLHVGDLTNAIIKTLYKNVNGFNEYYLGSGHPQLLKEYLYEIGNIYNANDLLLFGKRKDDGLIFDKSWMDNTKGIKFLGKYIKKDFRTRILDDKQKNNTAHPKRINIYNSFLRDAKYIFPFIQNDNRGFFVKDYQLSVNHLTQCENFYTFSRKNVIRGMHYQAEDEQGKIVSCLHGTILDVIIDLRKTSKTYMQKQYVVLSDKNHLAIYVPPGFAHGFLALTDATVLYRCNKEFNPKSDLGFDVFDKDANIVWGVSSSIVTISLKDLKLESINSLIEKI